MAIARQDGSSGNRFRYVSERDVDYSNLWRLLKAGQWREANAETLLKLLEASGRIESLIVSGQLTREGMMPLFQLMDTSGRLKLLEALALSERLLLEPVQRVPAERRTFPTETSATVERFTRSDIDALFRLLNLSDRFELLEALATSKRLPPQEQRTLRTLLELASLPSRSDSEKTRDRPTLLKSVVLGWKEQGWYLTHQDINNLPCADLHTIDRIWGEVSGGRFGFSIQQWIWMEEKDRHSNFADQVLAFGKRVGWHGNNTWIDYDSAVFSVKPESRTHSRDNAPVGHLPVVPLVGWWCWTHEMMAVFSRLDKCAIRFDSSYKSRALPADRSTLENDDTLLPERLANELENIEAITYLDGLEKIIDLERADDRSSYQDSQQEDDENERF